MQTTPIFFRYIRAIIATIVTVASFGVIYVLLYRTVPETNRDILNIVAGVVLSQLSNVINYYFGNSKDKSDAEQQARTPNTTTTQTTIVDNPAGVY